jgi:alanyl-tRNA synthetase
MKSSGNATIAYHRLLTMLTYCAIRFDFSLNRGMQVAEVAAVEKAVNRIIEQQLDVSSDVIPLKQAQQINGLRAVFGEVYPDPVRVISVGAKVGDMIQDPDADRWRMHSVEFCGGTHLTNTRQAKAFVIMEETAVAKGIRRISAVTGEEATSTLAASKSIEADTQALMMRVKSIPAINDQIDSAVEAMIKDLDESLTGLRNRLESSTVSYLARNDIRFNIEKIQKEIATMKNKLMFLKADESIASTLVEVQALISRGEKKAVIQMNLSADTKVTKKAMDEIRRASSDQLSFLVVATDSEASKVHLFAYVTENHQKDHKLFANEWIGKALAVVGGRGGGKASIAHGSVNGVSDAAIIASSALEALKANVKI